MLSIVTRVRILFYEGKRLALRDGESNPGLPRAASTDDRRGYLPLYYHGFAVTIRYWSHQIDRYDRYDFVRLILVKWWRN